ncbi:MAG: M56 family metallopeptidase [Acidimicrobiia bacterium]
MILTLIVVAGAGVLGLAGPGARLGQRLHPAHGARLILGALIVGVSLVEAGLVLWSTPVLLDVAGLVDLAAVCRRILGGPPPGGTPGGLAAGMGAVWLASSVVRGGWRVYSTQRGLRIDPAITPTDRREDFDLYVAASPRRMAYTVGGRRPQVIVTSAVADQLPTSLFEVIMAHEAVHARNRHHRFLALVAGVEAAFGWIHPVARAAESVRLSLERWADEDASLDAARGRSDVRRALLSACLTEATGAPGFGDPDMVLARISGLDGPAPSRASMWTTVAFTSFGCLSITALVIVTWATRMSILTLVHTGQCLV